MTRRRLLPMKHKRQSGKKGSGSSSSVSNANYKKRGKQQSRKNPNILVTCHKCDQIGHYAHSCSAEIAWIQRERIAKEKVSNSAGYELMKKDPNRPPTPIYQHNNPDVNAKANEQFVKWLECLKKHCYSEETEISPEQCKVMMKGLKRRPPYPEYDKVFPKNDVEQRKLRVKTPEITDWVRGDEWEEISTKWLTELNKFTQSDLYQMQRKNLSKLKWERYQEKMKAKKQKFSGEQPSEPTAGSHMEHGNFSVGTHLEDGNFEGPDDFYEGMSQEQHFETGPGSHMETENFQGPNDYYEVFENDAEFFEEVNDEAPDGPEVSGAMFRVDMIVQGFIFNKIPQDRRPVIPRPKDFMSTTNYLIAVENFEIKVAVEENIIKAQNEGFENVSQVSYGSDHELQDMQIEIEQEEEDPEIQIVGELKRPLLGKLLTN